MAITDQDRSHFVSLVQRVQETGAGPIVLYGAGQAVRALRPTLGVPAGMIVGIVDDDPRKRGMNWAGLPVMGLEDAVRAGAKCCIITLESAGQDAVWARRAELRRAGLFVLTAPQRFASKTWDDGLIEQYDVATAEQRGITIAYCRDYPRRNHDAERGYVGAAQRALVDGATVCEIGSGTGALTQHLIDRAGTYHCVDFSARLLHEIIEHRFFKHHAKLHVHHDESATLKGVPDRSIDLLVSFDVFVHFKQDLVHQFLNAAARVLRPNGSAVIHFLKWDTAAIETWDRVFRPVYGGGPDCMGYNSPADVSISCAHLGLRCEVLDVPQGAGRWIGKITRA